MVRNGAIIQTHTSKLEAKLDETKEEMMLFSIVRIRQNFNSDALELVVPFEIDYPETDVKLTIPKGGDRKKLLDLSEKNALHFIEEIKKKERLLLNIKDSSKYNLIQQVQEKLKLPQLPVHIECFDNSNFQGSYPVSAMVCFKNGVPSKKDYRRFNVKTVEGINDFATMKEAVYRRYKRLKEENQSFPQLVIIDGGKGQLSAATEAIEALDLSGQTTLIGLAKNVEEIFFTGDTQSMKLPYQSEELKFLRIIRDEVHRFGISFHRAKRSRGTFKNEIEDIKGIGKTTAHLLLNKYKSVSRIKTVAASELISLVGEKKANLIFSYFNKTAEKQCVLSSDRGKKMGPE